MGAHEDGWNLYKYLDCKTRQKERNLVLTSRKKIIGQCWIISRKKTMCFQDLRNLSYYFSLYSIFPFSVFLEEYINHRLRGEKKRTSIWKSLLVSS